MAQAFTHNASMDNSLTMVLDRFERSLTLQNNAIQESLALSANSFREHYLSAAKLCDGEDPKEFEHWLDDVQRLATLAMKSPEDVALVTSRGSLHRHVRELHSNGSTWEAIKTQLQRTFSDNGSSTMARHRLPHLMQNDMPMHEYISKFANLVEHAYGLSPTAGGSFILASTFIEGIMSPHVTNRLRSCKAQSLKDVFSQAILEDQKQKLRALECETPRADHIAHCEVNAIRNLSCYRCGSISHLIRECPIPAKPPQAPSNNRVKQHGNDNNTSNNGSNNGNIQNALTVITQALQALTNKIDKMHTPTQKSYHTNNYNKSHGHNKPHNHNRQQHSRYQHKQWNKHKQQTHIAEVEVCDCEECNHCPDDCTDCDSNPITRNDSPSSETPKN